MGSLIRLFIFLTIQNNTSDHFSHSSTPPHIEPHLSHASAQSASAPSRYAVLASDTILPASASVHTEGTGGHVIWHSLGGLLL